MSMVKWPQVVKKGHAKQFTRHKILIATKLQEVPAFTVPESPSRAHLLRVLHKRFWFFPILGHSALASHRPGWCTRIFLLPIARNFYQFITIYRFVHCPCDRGATIRAAWAHAEAMTRNRTNTDGKIVFIAASTEVA
jgi:hypothetical protein